MKTSVYNIQIVTKTGLHIGSGNAKIEIGGMDQPVIKDREGFPYIPASSLKGTLRSLYEVSLGEKELNKSKDGLKTFDGINYDEVSMFFGKAGDEKNNIENLGPTRFIFRDLKLKEELNEEDKIKGFLGKKELEEIRKSGENIYEEKMEVSIDRYTGTASKSGPRPLERVPAGIIFEGKIIVRLFEKEEILKQWDKNSEKEILNEKFGENLCKLKKLIENDFLGGQGSRGSGEIEIIFTEEIKKGN